MGSGGRLLGPGLRVLPKKLVLLLKVRGHSTTPPAPQPPVPTTSVASDMALGRSRPRRALGTRRGGLWPHESGQVCKVQSLHLLRTQRGGCPSLGSAASACGCKRPGVPRMKVLSLWLFAVAIRALQGGPQMPHHL